MSFINKPRIRAAASVVGTKEGEGPLGSHFDHIEKDPMFGEKTWELAESTLQRMAAEISIKKTGLTPEDVRYLLGGDLLGQLIATSFATRELGIPMIGLYGACSTMGEAMGIGAALIDSKNADRVVALASSHFASAEKQFRFPLGYGNQRPYTAGWTVTGAGAVILDDKEGKAAITGMTPGRIMDMGCKDAMNMGAAMAPAAYEVIYQHMLDFGLEAEAYDQIITGDLGTIGRTILYDFLAKKGIYIADRHMDCGIAMFDSRGQDTHAGGSGCGCAASVFCGYIFPKLERKEWKRILFVPTGALLSSTSSNEGQSIPGIAHAVMVEAI